MQKIIAILATMDTKSDIALYIVDYIKKLGHIPYLIDFSTKNVHFGKSDYNPLSILEHINVNEEEFDKLDKANSIATMARALEIAIPKLYKKGTFDAILSVGGGQNARLASIAMKALPIGVPKIVASSLSCGKRTMEQYVGTKDIFVLHTVADVSGLNCITKQIIHNICSSAIGMALYSEKVECTDEKIRLGATMLGITTKGTERVLKSIEAQEKNLEYIVFHANGVGGRCMEDMIKTGNLDVCLDMNLHEIACEMFGGYCAGAENRLEAAIEEKVPIVVVPGAIDMIDFFIDEQGLGLPENINELKRVYHNSSICHTKITQEQAPILAKVVAQRLNKAESEVRIILPTLGFCEASAPGGLMCDKEVDKLFNETLMNELKPSIKCISVEANINDEVFSKVVEKELLEIIQKIKEEKNGIN